MIRGEDEAFAAYRKYRNFVKFRMNLHEPSSFDFGELKAVARMLLEAGTYGNGFLAHANILLWGAPQIKGGCGA